MANANQEQRLVSLRARLVVAAAVISVGLGALCAGLASALNTADRARLPATAITLFAAIMAIATAGLGSGHPFPRLGPANLVTSTRAALVAMVAGLMLEPRTDAVAWAAVVVASIAAMLDGWDGWLARRTGIASPFGARFDMEIDALLILLLGGLVWRYDKAGAWVLLSGALRYIFVVAGWTVRWFERELAPSLRRKTVCVVQIIGLIVATAPLVQPPLSSLAAGATLALLVWSFWVDVAWLRRHRFDG